jgi:hypothetical protein
MKIVSITIKFTDSKIKLNAFAMMRIQFQIERKKSDEMLRQKDLSSTKKIRIEKSEW